VEANARPKAGYRDGVMFCLAATIAWGVMFPVMGDALRHIDPFTFTSLRYGIATIAFAITLIAREGWRSLDLTGERAVLAWVLGTIGFVGFGYCVFLGQKLAGPSGALNASIMMATMPMIGFLVSWALRRGAPSAVSFLFIAMSFAGVATVITKGDLAALVLRPRDYGASLLIVAGAVCWVVYTIGPTFFPRWSPYRYTAITGALGLTSVLSFNAVFVATGIVAMPPADAFVAIIPHIAYMALIAGYAAVLCWTIGNSILGPQNGILFQDVVPVTSFIVSTAQGIVPVKAQIVGSAITGAALILNNLYLRRRANASLQKCVDGGLQGAGLRGE
jgi:drug/metabolite transporter (DMT)-like permease